MSEIDAKDFFERFWNRFIQELSIVSFGEADVVMKKRLQKNLMGSVSHHKSVAIQAFVKTLDEFEENK